MINEEIKKAMQDWKNDPEAQKRHEEGKAWVRSEEGQKALNEARAQAKKAVDEINNPRCLLCLLNRHHHHDIFMR